MSLVFFFAMISFLIFFSKGDTLGQLSLACRLDLDQRYEEAYQYYRLSADQGNVEAQYCVALMFEAGRGEKKKHQRKMRTGRELRKNRNPEQKTVNLSD